MKFEHLVEVNDLHDTKTPNLTLNELWDGLKRRAYKPDEFLLGLEKFTIEKHSPTLIHRELIFPNLIINDKVEFYDDRHSIEYTITPSGTLKIGNLSMTIEEPENQALFVRFNYLTEYTIDVGHELHYDEFVKQAYLCTDIETIKHIRSLY